MDSLFKKITGATSGLTTYSVGLLQAKAFRILKNHTRVYLEDFDISTVDWAFLGVLYEHPHGIRLSEVANKMGVKAPFVTRMLKNLQKKKIIALGTDSEDARVKMVVLTVEGRKLVSKIESGLRKHMRVLVKGASVRELLGYVSILKKIIKNMPEEVEDIPDDPYTF